LGIDTETGWYAYGQTRSPVQLDLVDLEGGNAFDSKRGPLGGAEYYEISRQSYIIGKPVDLVNNKLNVVIPDFVIRSFTWVNVPNGLGRAGFSDTLKGDLYAWSMNWMYLY
jgi:hypothetical protein